MTGASDRGRSSSPRPRIWSAADSDRCECVLNVMPNDVLLGRGSGPNDHVGNIKFRDLVHERKAEYLSTNHRQTKALIAKDIVDLVYGRGGRFLKKLGPVESAKILPSLLAKNGMDDAENDRADGDSPGPVDVYQIQKHSTVMEKAKQALRQNQRNGSPDVPEHRGDNKGHEASARRNSLGHTNNNAPQNNTPRNGIIMNNGGNNNNNWNGMMGNIPTTFNDNSHGNHNSNRYHQGNNNFEMQNSNYSNSPQGRSQQDTYQQQLLQQQQNLLELQQQHEMLQMQFQQRQQQHSQQQMEMEQHNNLLQEQLELQIRQEQLRLLQQRSMQNIANSAAVYSNHQQEPDRTPSQSNPPAVLDGYATYTTTLDAIEDHRHTPHDGLADPQAYRGDMGSEGNGSDSKIQDDKSMQMSTMMGSFKDLSVKDGEDHSMSQSIGTIEGVGIPSGLSTEHMSGLSMLSMLEDSTNDFKNPHKAGNDVGAKNASWGNNSSTILADVIESTNPAAVAAAAVLGRSVPSIEKAQRRWSGGFIPTEVIPQTTKRFNRRGSLQYTSNNANSHHNAAQDLNQMQATASAMLAMAQRDHERQEQSFNYLNSPNDMNFGNQGMMNQGYHMDGMNAGHHG